jgi:NADH-quinone oxidoreductase subunit H
MGALFATMFLGGWRGWGAEQVPILGVFYLFLKAFFIYWVIMWVKYTVPRVRIDHTLALNWKFLVPLGLGMLIVTAILDKFLVMFRMSPGGMGYTFWMLVANLAVVWVTLGLLRNYAQLQRQQVGQPRPVATPELSPVSKS